MLAFSGIVSTIRLILRGVGAAQAFHFKGSYYRLLPKPRNELTIVGLIFGIGMLALGVVCGGSTALSYTIDCFTDVSGESMIIIIIIRNTLGFGFSYAITPWVENEGLLKCLHD